MFYGTYTSGCVYIYYLCEGGNARNTDLSPSLTVTKSEAHQPITIKCALTHVVTFAQNTLWGTVTV